MSLRTFKRLTMMSVLVLGSVAATGCGDDDNDKPEKDAGGDTGGNNDGSTGNNGEDAGNNGDEDSGVDAGPKPLMCGDGTEECKGTKLLGVLDVPSCCAEGEDGKEVCGVKIKEIPGPLSEPFAECEQQNQPSLDVPTPICDLVLGMVNGTTGISAGPANIKFNACCRTDGMCGIDTNDVDIVNMTTGEPMDKMSLLMGCVSLGKFSGSVPAGTQLPPGFEDLDKIPCVPPGDGG